MLPLLIIETIIDEKVDIITRAYLEKTTKSDSFIDMLEIVSGRFIPPLICVAPILEIKFPKITSSWYESANRPGAITITTNVMNIT